MGFLHSAVSVSGGVRRHLLSNVQITFDNIPNTFTRVTTGQVFPSTGTMPRASFTTTCRTIMSNSYSYTLLPIRGDFGNSINGIVSLNFFNSLCIANICRTRVIRGLLDIRNTAVGSVGGIIDRPRTLNRYTNCVHGRN